MQLTLENNYTWEQIGEQTADKIEKNVKSKGWNRKHFLEWFQQRKKVGYRFSWEMIFRAYKIWKQLKDENDHFICIVGGEGSGKTTLALQLGAWINPEMTKEDILYNANEYIYRLQQIAENYKEDQIINKDKVLIMDEGGIDLFSREAMKLSNRQLSKCFFVQRFLNTAVIICIPNFFMLDPVIRDHRCETLISITKRGCYKAITGTGIPYVSKMGMKNKNVNTVKLMDGTFWTGRFSIMYPSTISKEEYNDHKLEHIQNFLSDTLSENIEQKMIPATRLSRAIGASQQAIIDQIKKDKIKGRKIGGKWFIQKKELDRLTNA